MTKKKKNYATASVEWLLLYDRSVLSESVTTDPSMQDFYSIDDFS